MRGYLEHLEQLEHAVAHKTRQNTEFQPGTPGTIAAFQTL